MAGSSKIIRRGVITLAYVAGASAAVFVALVIGKLFITVPTASAASSVLYPHFCLGGWSGPQNAAGPASLNDSDPASAYTTGNSAYLASAVSAQLFCGYFSTSERTHPPEKVVVSFLWSMGQGESTSTSVSTTSSDAVTTPTPPSATPTDSLSSASGYVISPSTGFTIASTTSEASSSIQIQIPASVPAPAATSGDADASATPPASPAVPPVPSPAAIASSTPTVMISPTGTSTPPAVPTSPTPPSPTPPPPPSAPVPSDATSSSTAPSSSGSSPTSFIDRALSLIAPPAYGQTSDNTASDSPSSDALNTVEQDDGSQSNAPFLEVSYSTDGVRWIVVGTVGLDNWKNYSVTIPVTSWTDVDNLQIMLNPIPSLDPKPDIYLESMAVDVDYNRTITEAISDAVAAAADALGDLTVDSSPAAPPVLQAPQVTTITHKKLLFSIAGAAVDRHGSDLKPSISADGDSLIVSGNCSKKYFVILLFRNASDYASDPSSAVANGAWPCVGGSFSYDLSALSPDTGNGTYYLMTGEEGDSGPWTPVSNIVPIAIAGSTTIETVTQ